MSEMLTNSYINSDLLLNGYANGVFPMSDNAKSNEVYWVEPKLRGIIPLNGFHVSRSLKKSLIRVITPSHMILGLRKF